MRPKEDREFWDAVLAKAKELGSDGCTCVPEFYHECCCLHDIFYRTHKDMNGDPITKEEADKQLEECIISRSWFGQWSPMAHWRYWAVKKWGTKAWEHDKDEK